MPDPNFSIPGLMRIESPREAGIQCAPLMQGDFSLRGPMEMQTPVMDFQATGTMLECRDLDTFINDNHFGEPAMSRTAPFTGWANTQTFGDTHTQRPILPPTTTNVSSFGDLTISTS